MEHTDPVCKMQVEEETAAGKSTFEGRDYYFCNTGCKTRFDANPRQFVGEPKEREH